MVIFIQAKHEEYVVGLDNVEPRDQFEFATCNIRKIALAMNSIRHFAWPKNDMICKDKWRMVYGDFNMYLTI
jgi:hypothetical protein